MLLYYLEIIYIHYYIKKLLFAYFIDEINIFILYFKNLKTKII